jgi:cytoskeletal protein RodZ
MQLQEVDMSSPLGETLRRARLSKNVTFEDAERVTRIRREYLEALEREDYGRLPAPVYARGFLRSYAGYLGLDPGQLMPFFPVGHVEEPSLDPLPEVNEPRTWNMNGVLAIGFVGFLILLVIALYAVGNEGTSSSFSESTGQTGTDQQSAPLVVPQQPDTASDGNSNDGTNGGAPAGPAAALPDLAGMSVEDAVVEVERTGASYAIILVKDGDFPSGQVVSHDPAENGMVGPGDVVTLLVSQ